MAVFGRRLGFPWIFIAASLAALVLGPDYIRFKLTSLFFSKPEIDCLTFFQMPETEHGQLATASIEISNRGGLPLLLSNFRKSCACDSLLAKINGEFVSFTNLEIKPYSSVEVQFIQRARGEIGKEMVSPVIFNSNDPDRPEISITFRFPLITGGVSFSPSMIDFGAIKPGDVYETNVDVFDKSGKNRKILEVRCSDAQLLKVKFNPPEECKVKPNDSNSGSFLGQVNIKLSSIQPKAIQESIKIFVHAREESPDQLQIIGKVASPVEFSPSEIVLPRNSINGPIYTATIICKSPFKESFSIKSATPNQHFDIKITKKNTDTITAEVTFHPAENHRMTDKESLYLLNFVADFSNKKYDFRVPIFIKQIQQ